MSKIPTTRKHIKTTKSLRFLLASLLLASVLIFGGCADNNDSANTSTTSTQDSKDSSAKSTQDSGQSSSTETTVRKSSVQKKNSVKSKTSAVSTSNIPKYSGEPYIKVHKNVPYFKKSDLTTKVFEKYSTLDGLGRCRTAFANVCKATMPKEKRGRIGMVKPSGWHTVKYDNVDGKYLYNRCHLIGYQLTAENANERNLITGTRYMNVDGMLPFENMVADYVRETSNHVLYRVTPMFKGNNLVADGVLMEAESVEDKGDGISFCVFVYNVQPGIKINYQNGDSSARGGESSSSGSSSKDKSSKSSGHTSSSKGTYVINENTKKFHKPSCYSVKQMKGKNKKTYTGKRSRLIQSGYEPCKNCNP